MSITNDIVIQLGKFNETVKKRDSLNSIWTNHCKQQITINEGDQVMVSKSYIDTRNLSSSAIVIAEDTELELEMWYYWINDSSCGSQESAFVSSVTPAPSGDPGSNSATGTGAWYKPYNDGSGTPTSGGPVYKAPEWSVVATLQTSPLLTFQPGIFGNTSTQQFNNLTNGAQIQPYADGHPYLLCNSNNTPFTQTWRYTLKKGTYSPAALAELLTVAMSEVKKETAAAFINGEAVEWFNPDPINVNYAANPPPPQNLDQPFIVQSNGSPPIWAHISRQTDPSSTQAAGELSIVSIQPYVQIHSNQGIPNFGNAPNPGYSLCFKNIISDAPIDPAQMFPPTTVTTYTPVSPATIPPTYTPNVVPNPNPNFIPLGGVIPAYEMIPGLTYTIVTLGLTNWLRCGDTIVPPAVGNTFICLLPDNRDETPIPVQQIVVNDMYDVAFFGVPMNITAQVDIPAIQCIIGNNYSIVTLNATNWNSIGFIGTPTVGGTFTCTAKEIIPSPGSFKPTNYQNMVPGIEYTIINLGLAYAPGGVTYDTAWVQLGDTNPTLAVGNIFTCVENYNIPIPNNNLLTNIVDGITFTITATSDLINWGALGYLQDPNIVNPSQVIPVVDPILLIGYTYEIVSLGVLFGVVGGQSIYDTNWINLTEQSVPNPPGYTTPVVGDRFFTDTSVINPQTYINNGALLNIVPIGQTLLVEAAGDINWSLYGTLPQPGNFVYTHMIPTEGYQIVSLGLAYAPGGLTYDTAWAQLGDTNATIAVGDVFTNTQQYNIPIPNTNLLANIIDGIGFTITATTDNIFWGALGYLQDPNINNPNQTVSISAVTLVTGDTYEIMNTGVSFGIYSGSRNLYDTQWFYFTSVEGASPNNNFTMKAGDFTTIVLPQGWVPADIGQPVYDGETLNMIPANAGVTLNVTQVGDIPWNLYGTIANSTDFSVVNCVPNINYTVTFPGAEFTGGSAGGSPFISFSDSQWDVLDQGGPFFVNVGDTFLCYQSVTPQISTLDNIDTGTTNEFFVYQIVDLGVLTDDEWVKIGATSPAVVGQIFIGTGRGKSGGTVYNVLYFYIQVGFSITINTPGSTNWMAFGSPSNTAGTTFTVTTGYTLGMDINLVASEAVSFTMNITGRVSYTSGIPPAPFNITITSNPGNAGNDDVSFTAICVPTGTVRKTQSYQSLLPFTFTATANGVDNPTYAYTYAGEVIGSGTVKSITPTVPFEIGITSNPGNAVPTDTTFVALTYPTGTVRFIDSYQSLLPFTFKATATGVDNPNENYTYSGFVDGAGEVDEIFVDGICKDTAPVNMLFDTDWVHVGNTQLIPTNNNPFTCTDTYAPWAFQNYFFMFVVNVSYKILSSDASIDWSLFCTTLPAPPYNFSLSFICNAIPATLPTGQFSAIINATGTLGADPGTVQETIGQNFFLYPMVLAANPNAEQQAAGINDNNSWELANMYNYQFPIVGSTEISIQYNQDTNRFEWLYIDTPIMQQDPLVPPATGINTSQFIERVGIINTFNPVPLVNPSPEVYNNLPIKTSSIQYKSSTCKLVSKSGCMFRKMNPPSFWQDIMGFSSDLLVTDAELGLSDPAAPKLNPISPNDVNRFTYKRFNSVTTRGLLTTDMNFTDIGVGVPQGSNPPQGLPHINAEPSYISQYPVNLLNNTILSQWYQYEMAWSWIAYLNLGTVPAPNPGDPNELSIYNILNGFGPDPSYPLTSVYSQPPQFNSKWYDALSTRVVLSSSQPPLLVSDETGHYLLEIEGYSGGGLLNEQQKYNIKSIVSGYYVNPGSFTSGVFPDPQVYTHVGEPLVLQNFTVRILNPITMKPIGGLGENSCIYLQVNKSYTELQQKQNDST